MDAQTAGQARRTRARIAASVVVLGAAASVAGLGTFGTFTDSTTPVVSRLDTGVLSIALTEAAADAAGHAVGAAAPQLRSGGGLVDGSAGERAGSHVPSVPGGRPADRPAESSP